MFDRSKSFQDEDPYSLPANSSSSSGGSGGNSNYGQKQNFDKPNSRPPKLPPRDVFGKKPPINLPKPDYEDNTENNFLGGSKTKKDFVNNKFGKIT